MPHVSTGVITDTGTKGLLRWIEQAMPDFYRQLSPVLLNNQAQVNMTMISQMPQMAGLSCPSPKLAAIFGGLGDGDDSDNAYFTPSTDENSGNAYFMPSAGSIDLPYTADINESLDNSAIYTDLNIQPGTDTSKVSAAGVASQGATSSSTAGIITSLANAIGTGTIAAAQISANNTLLQTNLLRAQQGLPPLTASGSAATGISLGSSSTLMILGIAAVAAVALMGKKSA